MPERRQSPLPEDPGPTSPVETSPEVEPEKLRAPVARRPGARPCAVDHPLGCGVQDCLGIGCGPELPCAVAEGQREGAIGEMGNGDHAGRGHCLGGEGKSLVRAQCHVHTRLEQLR